MIGLKILVSHLRELYCRINIVLEVSYVAGIYLYIKDAWPYKNWSYIDRFRHVMPSLYPLKVIHFYLQFHIYICLHTYIPAVEMHVCLAAVKYWYTLRSQLQMKETCACFVVRVKLGLSKAVVKYTSGLVIDATGLSYLWLTWWNMLPFFWQDTSYKVWLTHSSAHLTNCWIQLLIFSKEFFFRIPM